MCEVFVCVYLVLGRNVCMSNPFFSPPMGMWCGWWPCWWGQALTLVYYIPAGCYGSLHTLRHDVVAISPSTVGAAYIRVGACPHQWGPPRLRL